LIVNPLLYVHFTRKSNDDAQEALITREVSARLAKEIWQPCLVQSSKNEIDDNLVIELLQMSVILVQYCHRAVADHRKDIVKVSWDCMRTRDATARHMGYLLGARFFTAYESPQNFVRNTWNGLLKTKESEARSIYRRAIDVLADCLPIRDPPPPTGLPHWATAVKRVLVEDGHTTPQLVTICELIVGHGDLFYDSRDLFVSLMANSLTKLGFVPGATVDMKKLTIDIVELIFRWERRRMTGSPSIKPADESHKDSHKRAGSSDPPSAKKQRLDRAGTAASTSSAGGWQLPVHVRELITSYLVRLVSTSSESLARGGLTARALNLLREILGPDGLPGVTAKLSFFQRTMGGVSRSTQ
jgi:transformation/transcription domain-associated protein